MQEFKRGIISILWSTLIAIATPVFLYFIISIFTENRIILFSVPTVVFIFLILQTIFGENIKIEINDNKFKYYKKNELLHDLDLKNYAAGYRAKTSDGTADSLTLQLVEVKTGEELFLDCTSLGQTKFYNMYETVSNVTETTDSKKLKTKKKEQ